MLAQTANGISAWVAVVAALVGAGVAIAGSFIVEVFRTRREEKRAFIDALKTYYADAVCAYYDWKDLAKEKKKLGEATGEAAAEIRARINIIESRYARSYHGFVAESTVLIRLGTPQTKEFVKQLEGMWNTELDVYDETYEEKLFHKLDELRKAAQPDLWGSRLLDK